MAAKKSANTALQQKVKVLAKLYDSGCKTEKDLKALSLQSILKIPDISVSDMTVITELQEQIAKTGSFPIWEALMMNRNQRKTRFRQRKGADRNGFYNPTASYGRTKYTYRQSTQIEGQTGSIGYLRGDFGAGGKEFFSSWFDHRRDLKTDEFKSELDEVINALRSEEYGLLKSRTAMAQYAGKYPDSAFQGNYATEYGFRADTENTAS